MENSSIQAKYVYYFEDKKIIEYNHNITNVSQLSKYVTNHNFGDLVAFSEYRDIATKIIGKNGELIENPDYSDAGYLTIPYEITQYLDNAVSKYQEVEYMYIDLRHDDNFIKEKINTTSCKIKKEWNWKLTLYDTSDMLFVKFPNGKEQAFDVNQTSAYKIKKWFDASKKEQSKLRVYYRVEGDKYEKFREYSESNKEPKIPSTWSFEWEGGGGGLKNSYSNFTYKGPSDEEEKVIKSISDYYRGCHFTITKLTN